MEYDKMYAEIMKVFKARRIAKGLKLHDVANYLGVAKGTVHNYESGYGHPSLKNFIQWSRLLGIGLGDIDIILDYNPD